jgi:hypothetical protein
VSTDADRIAALEAEMAEARSKWSAEGLAHEIAKRERDAALAREQADQAEAAAMREALEEVRRRHRGLEHGEDCHGNVHNNGDCGCPNDGSIHADRPCIDEECSCCLSLDTIATVLVGTAGRALAARVPLLEAVAKIGSAISLPCICHVTDGKCTGCRFLDALAALDEKGTK